MKHPQKIIDSHMHLWDLSLDKNPWLTGPMQEFFLGDYTALQQNYLPKDYRHDASRVNIEHAVFVQAGWDRADLLAEAQWVNQVNDGLVGAIVAFADLTAVNADEQLAQLATVPLVRGIRQIIAWHENPLFCACEKDFLKDPTWQANFRHLAAHQFSFDLQIYPEQADDAYELLKQNPQIPVVIEHILQPTHHDEASLQHWEEKLKRLSTLPNVYLKLSGMNIFQHTFNFETFARLVKICVDTFSAARCMTGSNFPVEKLFVSLETLYASFFKATAHYSDSERQDLFYGTAQRVYQIKL